MNILCIFSLTVRFLPSQILLSSLCTRLRACPVRKLSGCCSKSSCATNHAPRILVFCLHGFGRSLGSRICQGWAAHPCLFFPLAGEALIVDNPSHFRISDWRYFNLSKISSGKGSIEFLALLWFLTVFTPRKPQEFF